jgi:hypothetical protein
MQASGMDDRSISTHALLVLYFHLIPMVDRGLQPLAAAVWS